MTLWKRPTYFVFTMSTYRDWRRISRSLFLLITITRFWRKLNSSPIDELRNWCLKGYWGDQLWKGSQAAWEGEPPLPAAANWHCHTERILSEKYLPKWNTYLHTPAWLQGGRRGSKNPPRFASTKQKGDPQRSARIACKIMQKDSSPENPKWATPHVTHANTGTPLAALARG